jgi:enamine deaminase RidA (YjgF/YER057c/UK114 family)
MDNWKKKVIRVPELDDPVHKPSHEQCVAVGPLVFVAGMTGWRDGAIADKFSDQTKQAFEKIRLALSAAGAGLEDIVMMTVYLTDVRYQPEFSRIRREVLAGNLTCSATIGINQLFDPRALIEIQAIAVMPEAK